MTSMSRHLSPRYGNVILVSGYLFDSCQLTTPAVARKFHISHWFACGGDGRAYGHEITKISRMARLPNFLRYGAPVAVLENTFALSRLL